MFGPFRQQVRPGRLQELLGLMTAAQCFPAFTCCSSSRFRFLHHFEPVIKETEAVASNLYIKSFVYFLFIAERVVYQVDAPATVWDVVKDVVGTATMWRNGKRIIMWPRLRRNQCSGRTRNASLNVGLYCISTHLWKRKTTTCFFKIKFQTFTNSDRFTLRFG